MEAKQHQPEDETARTLEAVGYFQLGDKAQANVLAENVLKEYPNCSLATAVRIRSAPPEISFSVLEQSVPAALRGELDVAHALGWRALTSGDVATAERLTLSALKVHPDSTELQELLGTAIVQAEGRARQANQLVTPSRLEEAISAISAGLAKHHSPQDIAQLRYTRAEAYGLLGKTEHAETDFRAATDVDKEEPEIIRRFALFLSGRGRDSVAIEVLRRADKARPDLENRLLLASFLGERNDPGDRESASTLLRETIPIASAAPPEMRAATVARGNRPRSSVGQGDGRQGGRRAVPLAPRPNSEPNLDHSGHL
jgi:tetratricopeptide (TPR) repeat protein